MRPRHLALVLSLLLACQDDHQPGVEGDRPGLVDPPTAFSVREVGAGPPLVFIPGLSSPGEVWRQAVDRYQSSHRCLVLSLAGFAGQPPSATITGSGSLLAAVRGQLAAYLRQRRLQGAVVVGHSLGGVIALSLAAEAPELVGGLIVVDGLPFLPAALSPGATPQSTEPQAAALRAILRAQTPEQYAGFVRASRLDRLVTRSEHVELITGWALASDPATVGQAMYDVYVTDLRPELPRVRAPALIMATWVGMMDVTTRAGVEAQFRQQYQALAGAEVVVSDQARHFIMLDEPQWLWTQMDGFMAGRLGARAAAPPDR